VLSLGRCFYNRFHFRQTLLELTADHFVHVHEQVDCLGHEFLSPAMLHVTAVCLPSGLNVNSAVLMPCEGFEEFHFDADQIAWTALNDRHASLADLFVTDPSVDRAGSGRRAFVGLLHRGIDFSPRVPCFPFMEIVYLGKYPGAGADIVALRVTRKSDGCRATMMANRTMITATTMRTFKSIDILSNSPGNYKTIFRLGILFQLNSTTMK
jgi:hypothetical protein